ncbi:MAG: TetR family transcriptional regulator [Nitriliruptorales bacterium]|nr:TetR family transcriptional regulator [Nitriliruptorales bacterium]
MSSRTDARPTRERILTEALRLFAERGVDGTAVTDIEAAAGLSPGSGSFYRHFSSKQDVLDEVVTGIIEASDRSQQDRLLEAHTGPLTAEVLRDQYLAVFELLADMGQLIDLLARERHRLPELAELLAERMVATGIATEGKLARATEDEQALGAIVISALTGYHLATQFFGAPPGDVDRERFATALARLALGQS